MLLTKFSQCLGNLAYYGFRSVEFCISAIVGRQNKTIFEITRGAASAAINIE